MQRTVKENNINSVSRVRIFFGGFFWIMGLLAAGSEGAGMPWVNLAGLCVFLSSSLLLGRWFNQIGKTRPWTAKKDIQNQKTRLSIRPEKSNANTRVLIRFA